jgi:RNA polymerase sigma-70 factor (ECF subfamily)
MTDAGDRLADTVRIEGARILASLVRTVGDLSLAEDAVSDAAVAALREWPRTGVPTNPAAWLTVTARRKAIDVLRREGARSGKEQESSRLQELTDPDGPPPGVVRDDQLRLIFTCCHPALSPQVRVELALRTLCGLSPARIAAVMLSGEAAVAKRLTRARSKIADARIPYRVPHEAELPERLASVCGVIHALYTAGHAPPTGDSVLDVDLCAEALRLARLLHELLPTEPGPAAVLALLMLTEGRRPGRVDAHGDVVPLARQDRSRWDARAIAEGIDLLNSSLRRTGAMADPYQLQAAIAAEHARAARYAETDWAEIVRLYDLLLSVAPTRSARLNRVVAVAETLGAAIGLAALDDVPVDHRWHAVRAELLARSGRFGEAVEEVTASLDGDLSEPERRYRERQRRSWAAQTLP